MTINPILSTLRLKTLQKNICIALFFVVSQVLIAQQVVIGRITDSIDGSSIQNASIFVSNTTIGTVSDASGNYTFTVPGRGSFEIVVSHAGYQSVFHKMDIPQAAHQHNVALEIIELDEIIVSAARTYKKSDVDLFWRKILGEKPSRNGMEVLNPEKVYFYKRDNILKASSREPIEIVNHHTGYHIRFILKSFEYDYREEWFELDGMPFFEELIPRNNREKERWEKNRQKVYAVSLNNFLRALYKQQLHEEGFLLANTIPVMNETRIVPVVLDDILQVGPDAAQMDVSNPLALICYDRPVTTQMISDCNVEVLKRNARYIVVDLMPQRITVYPNGTYRGRLILREYENSVLGLSAILPTEYADTTPDDFSDYTDLRSFGLEQLEENLTAQLETWPQEKIHLHTDRDFYVSGEKIWFKAYLTDAHSHLYPVYIDDA